MRLKIVRCDNHDSNAVYVNDVLVYQYDYPPESLVKVAEHLGWTIEYQTISQDEFERRYC